MDTKKTIKLVFTFTLLSTILISGVSLLSYFKLSNRDNFKVSFNKLVDTYNESVDLLNQAGDINTKQIEKEIEDIEKLNYKLEGWDQLKANLLSFNKATEQDLSVEKLNYKIKIVNFYIKEIEYNLNENKLI